MENPMKPYIIAARLKFAWLAIVFTMHMLALIALALLPVPEVHWGRRRRELRVILMNVGKANTLLRHIRKARRDLRTWRGHTLRALADLENPGEVWLNAQNALLWPYVQRQMRSQGNDTMKGGEQSSILYMPEAPVESKPDALQQFRLRLNQLVREENLRHCRRLDVRDGLRETI